MTHVNPRLRTLRGRFIALIAVSATVLGLIAGSAIPARAATDSKDLGKFLFGLAAIALIVKAIDDNKRDDAPPVVVEPNPPHVKPTRIPATCAIEVTGLSHDRTGYSESCLRSYAIRNLPLDCAVSARIYGRPDRLFPASCLVDAGFVLGK